MAKTVYGLHSELAQEARQVVEEAQQEAMRMQAHEYHPEHLLLSLLKIDNAASASVFSLLGMDIRSMRQAATELVQEVKPPTMSKRQIQKILPSKEAQECLDWARSFAEQRRSPDIHAEHILLSVLRHPQVQPFLVLLYLPDQVMPAYLTEEDGAAYTHAMDQLIQIKIREHKCLDKSVSVLPLVTGERPTVTFADILGAESAKQELRPVISYLRRPQLYQRMQSTFLEETLLIGHPCTERKMLVHAIAGEAVVSLVSLSISKLVDLIEALQVGDLDQDTLAWLEQAYSSSQSDNVIQVTRSILSSAFEMAKDWAPCLLHLDDLDALGRLENSEVQAALQHRLLSALDALDWKQTMAVVATAYKVDMLDPELLQAGHFERRVMLSASYAIHPAAHTKLCLACRREALATWHFCVYCGASLTKACPNCGAVHVEVEGARYCFSCGTDIWNA